MTNGDDNPDENGVSDVFTEETVYAVRHCSVADVGAKGDKEMVNGSVACVQTDCIMAENVLDGG